MNDERYQNYAVIEQYINELESKRLTEDRLENYKQYFRKLREYFVDLRFVDSTNQDRSFRAAAAQGETYMQLLEQNFEMNVYLQLLYVLRYMTRCSFEEDELNNMMSSMGM